MNWHMSTFLAQFLSWRYCTMDLVEIIGMFHKKRRFTMKLKERYKVIAKVTAMDVYRCIILSLVGTFYGFLVFLMFL